MSKWLTIDQNYYVEVKPQTDTREHYAGDECWCNPEVQQTDGIPLITHNKQGLA